MATADLMGSWVWRLIEDGRKDAKPESPGAGRRALEMGTGTLSSSLDVPYKKGPAQFLMLAPSLLLFLPAWNADVMPGGSVATLQLGSYK